MQQQQQSAGSRKEWSKAEQSKQHAGTRFRIPKRQVCNKVQISTKGWIDVTVIVAVEVYEHKTHERNTFTICNYGDRANATLLFLVCYYLTCVCPNQYKTLGQHLSYGELICFGRQ